MEQRVQTKPYDRADYLESEEAIGTYLKAAFDEGDANDIRAVLNAVARMRGITGLSKGSGVAR
jgi:probable addiction module antidote protein